MFSLYEYDLCITKFHSLCSDSFNFEIHRKMEILLYWCVVWIVHKSSLKRNSFAFTIKYKINCGCIEDDRFNDKSHSIWCNFFFFGINKNVCNKTMIKSTCLLWPVIDSKISQHTAMISNEGGNKESLLCAVVDTSFCICFH